MAFNGAERRKEPRYQIQIKVRMTTGDTGEMLTGFSRDLSYGGIFVFLEKDIENDSTIAMQLVDRMSDTKLELMGKVVHVMRGLGIGVQFIDIDKQAKALLAQLIQTALDSDDN